MSSRFPQANYHNVIKVAKKLGFRLYRQAKGSHEIWYRKQDSRYTTIHNHGSKSIKRKTLKSMFADMQITAQEFVQLRKGKK